MRAMLVAFSVVTFVALGCATPLKRDKRFAAAFAGFPFGPFVSSGSFYPIPIPSFYGSRSQPVQPMFPPMFPFNFGPFPMPSFPDMRSWYEGTFGRHHLNPLYLPTLCCIKRHIDVASIILNISITQGFDNLFSDCKENVCKESKTYNDQMPDEFDTFLNDDDIPNMSSNFNHEQESCRGNDKKYVCIKRNYDSSGKAEIVATKYECCHGFVRNPNGVGCIESKRGERPMSSNEQYSFVPVRSASQSSSSSFSAKVSFQ
ncbi:uncharacterized protein CEXT_110151 [Caerostris extrusa]|uniref:Uncharacterized protein n=1 Tax=Caerostris extrusa TaxID=172846 RepID=A0AAV4XE13_CAEEX|nr:uncharacterized protein CEXT_110151 [Caerostris extrusa]